MVPVDISFLGHTKLILLTCSDDKWFILAEHATVWQHLLPAIH